MNGDILKCKIEIESIRYFKDNWGILSASVIEGSVKGDYEPITDFRGEITIKGNMPTPNAGDRWLLTAEEVEDAKYGLQYNIKSTAEIVDSNTTDKIGQKKFLLTIFTENQVEAMYNTLKDPWDTLYNSRYEELVQVKGIGINNAIKFSEKFNEKVPMSKMYTELEEYALTNTMMKKLLDEYKNPDIVIETVKSNPYKLIDISGVGWKKADEIALRADGDIYGVNRIKAYIKYCLENKANDGFSYISTDTLMDELVANLGEEIPDLKIAEAIHDLGEDELWWDEKKENIGLRKYYNLEKHIAEELIRLRDAENKFKYDGWEETIKHIQQVQGWEYTEQQYKGIETVLKNNVTVITGYGGTGKSSIAKGMLQILNHYSSALCALSGKAAVRLAEVSGQQGSTIHSLLAYPSPQDEIAKTRQNFGYNDINQLPQDIIIVDEGSMIDARLYYYLLRSIQTGSKLVILGDAGQLEPIGNGNVFADLIKSDEIPVVVLDKIHRQAAKSGIITDSIKLRKGIQILDKDETGEFIHGELKDFVIDAFSDSSNTYYEVLKYFQKELAEVGNIMDVQILSPVKTRGSACTWELNNALQELYNPKADNKKEIAVKYGKDRIGILREGDKVICTKNNRKLFNMDTEEICTVFNGNMGIIRSISSDQESIIVDFENIGGVFIPKEFFNSIELGMAISAHKSQGSQWKRVIVAIDFSAYALLTRELVYTAVTRAEEKNILVCQTSALRYAIGNERISIKLTHLPKLLYEVAHPVMKF